jgi:hypothetical protein
MDEWAACLLHPASAMRNPTAIALLLSAIACRTPADRRAEFEGPGPHLVRQVGDFSGPESVRYDPERDVYYVSNMKLYGSWKDDNGYIVVLDAGNLDSSRVLVHGGIDGVTLHAPKGMALQGDTLWVADIDVVRGFHRASGAPVATIDLTAFRPTLLNDVAVGPDGTIRVTDTGIVMSYKGVVSDTTGDRVFVIGRDRRVTALPAAHPFPKPNGIAWDARRERWLTVTFDDFNSVLYAMRDGADTARVRIAAGHGRWDGVEVLSDGRVLVTSWSDSSVHVVDAAGRVTPLVRHLPAPADLGVDTRRHRMAVPLSMEGRVEIWTLPDAPREALARNVPAAVETTAARRP